MFTQPAVGQEFFGRAEIIDVLDKRVSALTSGYRQNVALTGQMLAGKSSILRHFLSHIDKKNIIPVYVEVQDKSFSSFAEKFIGTLLYAYLKSENAPLSEDSNHLLSAAEDRIPETVRAIRKIKADIKKRRPNHAYRDLLELTSVFKKETGKSCVVILDEFHNLENFKLSNPFMDLGKIIMVQKNTMYIVSSSQRNTIHKILTEKLSLLFGNFEIVEVDGFDAKTARDFFVKGIFPVTTSSYYADYILNLTSGTPFYLKIISQKIREYAIKANNARVNVELLKNVFHDIFYSATGVLNQHFTNQIHYLIEKKNRKAYFAMLGALSQGPKRIKDILAEAKIDEKIAATVLVELCGIDLVETCGGFYCIHDRMFEFWLRNVYFYNQNALVGNIYDRAMEFNAKIEADIESYLIEYNKGVIARLQDLFSKFRGELVEFDSKTRKLPRTENVDVLHYADDNSYISCQTGTKLWISKIKTSYCEDSDVLDFIARTGARKSDTLRKVLISLGGIDTNALLIAKEKNIWVWDLKKINILLRLFGKQDIII